MKDNKPVFLRFLKYLLPVKWKLIGAIICGFYKFILPVIIAWIIGKIVEITSNEVTSFDYKQTKIIELLFFSLIIIIISPIFVYFRNILSNIAMEHVLNKLRIDLFSHLQHQSYNFYNSHPSGSLASRITTDVNRCEQFINEVIVTSWLQIAVVCSIFTYFLYTDVIMALLSVFLVPIHAYFLKILGNKIKLHAIKTQIQFSKLSGLCVENFLNHIIIKSFLAEKIFAKYFKNESLKLRNKSINIAKFTAFSQVINALIVNIAPIIVVGTGCFFIVGDTIDISISELVTFILMQRQMFDPLSKLAAMQSTISQSQGALERIYQIFDTPNENYYKQKSYNYNINKAEIIFSNISFYHDKSCILNNINFNIKSKQSLGITGLSGSGKSSIVNLLPRFYLPKNGTIKIDNININDIDLKNLRNLIGYVHQEPFLFSNTIYDNIIIGSKYADESQVYDAATKASIHEKIISLPNGYNTKIGERGSFLSGGERQRIALARVFLKKPKILILDEATSSLDSIYRNAVQKTLIKLMKNCTTLVISHDLNFLKKLDYIIVLDNGEIVEQGSHDHLIKLKSLYYNLFMNK